MYLVVGIGIITFLMTFSQNFIKFLLKNGRPKKRNESEVLQEIELAKNELKVIRESRMEEFSKLIRTLRIENKIKGLHANLRGEQKTLTMKEMFTDLLYGYAVKLLFVLMLTYISFKYRYTPVVVFDDRLDFAPLGGILAFPTGVPNTISVPFWIFSCNLSYQFFGGYLSKKFSKLSFMS